MNGFLSVPDVPGKYGKGFWLWQDPLSSLYTTPSSSLHARQSGHHFGAYFNQGIPPSSSSLYDLEHLCWNITA